MRIKIVLTHVACAVALAAATALGMATSADDASIKRLRDGGSVPDVVVLYEDGSGTLDDGTTFCIDELGWGCGQPVCPTEDSCTVDYADGRWTVREVTP